MYVLTDYKTENATEGPSTSLTSIIDMRIMALKRMNRNIEFDRHLTMLLFHRSVHHTI
jgi:hypothetical protein